jgi:hypothetical protein
MSQRGFPGTEFSSAVRRRDEAGRELRQPAVTAGIAAAPMAKPMKARRE